MLIEIDGQPYNVLDVFFATPTARGASTMVRTKLKNLLNGAVQEKSFRTSEKFPEPDVELALREALVNAVVHGNQKDPEKKVHIRCRCGPGKEISVVVTDQGKGFDFEKTVGNGLIPDPAAERGRGISMMKVYMDDVHFERDGSEVHMRKRARNNSH